MFLVVARVSAKMTKSASVENSPAWPEMPANIWKALPSFTVPTTGERLQEVKSSLR